MAIAEHNIVLRYKAWEGGEGKFEKQPFLVKCSCGHEGRYEDEGLAVDGANKHMQMARSVNITFQNLAKAAR